MKNMVLKSYTHRGLSIRTPLNIEYQIQAINSLRKGIEEFDRRQGWRGPITNKKSDKNWQKKIEKIKLDPTFNGEFAEITDINDLQLNFKILNEEKQNLKEFLN